MANEENPRIKFGSPKEDPIPEKIAQFQKDHPFGCADSVATAEGKVGPLGYESGNFLPVANQIDRLINTRGKMGYSLSNSFPLETKLGHLLRQEIILVFTKK